MWDGGGSLNITIKAEKSEDGKAGKLVISDTGIGMSEQELTANLVCKTRTISQARSMMIAFRVLSQNLALQSSLLGQRERKGLLKEI